MTVPACREEAKARIVALVRQFELYEQEYTRAGTTYNETQARSEFITPLFEALGWDVYNDNGQPIDLREVIQEATVEVGDERLSKKPDYEMRAARARKFFIEAKKPAVPLDRDRPSSFQTRRYGFSGSLAISVLTNFRHLAIYDCVPTPQEDDPPGIARIAFFGYEDYEARFDELYDSLSREAVFSGAFDERFEVPAVRHGTQQFDQHFLRQVRSWRERLALDVHANSPELNSEELSYVVQLFLSRIVFLRICEDRDIERYETLRELPQAAAFNGLMGLIRRADRFYDSGLFRLLEDERLGARISDELLATIVEELYYPQSPYTFSVVEAGVLGEIYEQFLGEVIVVNDAGDAEIIEKPEVKASGGVVPTPQYIVDAILERTLAQAIDGKPPNELSQFTVADTCCGSGVFLLRAFEILINHCVEWYVADGAEQHAGTRIYEVMADQWRLTFQEKRRILLQSIRGVDIDPNAVEVARFSLLLRLIEDETAEALRAYERAQRQAVLPDLDPFIRNGNSLVSHEELAAFAPDAEAELTSQVRPFTWEREFPEELGRGGFDVIVGNPPYIRIQHMVTYSPREVELYQSEESPYTTAHANNFDKYALFIERSLSLLKEHGRLGLIVPNKFLITAAGRAVRRLLAETEVLDGLVYFGAQQVFGPGTSNYTCLLFASRPGRGEVQIEDVSDVNEWRYGGPGELEIIPIREFGEDAWSIGHRLAEAIFERVRDACPASLGGEADIFVGVQTSADGVYIVETEDETPESISFTWDAQRWTIERGILRPCLHDVRLHAYGVPNANKHMIFPYRLDERRASLIQPDEMRRAYPGAWSYLCARRDELEDRNIMGGRAEERQFYQFGRSQSLVKFNSPKIILPILSKEARYAYDDQNIVVTGGGNGPYYLVRPARDSEHTLYFLLAVLCHPVSEAIVRCRPNVFRGGYYSHGKQYIETLPVPDVSAEERHTVDGLVRRTIDATSAAHSARTPAARAAGMRESEALRLRVEASVSSLFGLTDADLAVIGDVPVPS